MPENGTEQGLFIAPQLGQEGKETLLTVITFAEGNANRGHLISGVRARHTESSALGKRAMLFKAHHIIHQSREPYLT